MSLVMCPDCGKYLSDTAPTCIQCGRPMQRAPDMEVCEVILRNTYGGPWRIGKSKWVLEAQVLSPTGLKVIASRPYKSDWDIADYQGESKGFQQARRDITDSLLRDGWQPLDSIGVGGSVTLPRFNRPVGAGPVPLPPRVRGDDAAVSFKRSYRVAKATPVAWPIICEYMSSGGWVFQNGGIPGLLESRWSGSVGSDEWLTVKVRSMEPAMSDHTEIELIAWSSTSFAGLGLIRASARRATEKVLTHHLDRFEANVLPRLK